MRDSGKKPDEYLKNAEMSTEANNNMVGDGIINNTPPPDDEKRMVQSYEVKTAIHIGDKEIVFAQDLAAAEPYMVCNCQWDNPLGIDIYDKVVADSDYLEAMTEFLSRVATEVQHTRISARSAVSLAIR